MIPVRTGGAGRPRAVEFFTNFFSNVHNIRVTPLLDIPTVQKRIQYTNMLRRRVLPDVFKNSSSIASYKQPSRQRSKRFKTLVLTLVSSVLLLLGILVRVHCTIISTSTSIHASSFFSSDPVDPEEGVVALLHDVKSNTSNVAGRSDDDQQISVFYNVYTNSEHDIPTVKKVVEEQLSFLRPNHRVFVRSIGVPLQIDNTTLIQHDNTGSEIETLAVLWQHCKDHTDEKVVYIHSKGSFHPSADNHLLRSFQTRGALSEECEDLPPSCNVCSSRMSPIPHPHAPGNMWLGRCDYIQTLMDPKLLADAMDKVEYKDNWGLSGSRIRHYCVGGGRYAAEHWVHSHPRMSACDLHKDATYAWTYKGVPSHDFEKS